MSLDRTPCLCGCPQTFSPRRSLALCTSGGARAYAAFLETVAGLAPDAYQRAYFRFYSSPAEIAAALARTTAAAA